VIGRRGALLLVAPLAGACGGSVATDSDPAVAALGRRVANVEATAREATKRGDEWRNAMEDRVAELERLLERARSARPRPEAAATAPSVESAPREDRTAAARREPAVTVSDVTYREVESSSFCTKFTWSARVRNRTDARVEFTLKVELRDSGDSKVAMGYDTDLRIDGSDVRDFGGSISVFGADAQRVQAAVATLERWATVE
jgi:hypothetical protein